MTYNHPYFKIREYGSLFLLGRKTGIYMSCLKKKITLETHIANSQFIDSNLAIHTVCTALSKS